MDEPTFTINELNTVIRGALSEAFPHEVWVRGEVQRIATARTGHTYFELVEKDSRRERVAARIDVALFKGNAPTIKTRLREVPGVTLAPDIEVRIRGRIDYYPTGGRLQLVMTDIDPIFTVGGMAANRERVLRALATEDLLQRNGALPLAPVPLRVGLITSKGSAAYHDFVHELERSGFAWQVVLADVRVQGGGAPQRVTWALRAFASLDVDVVVVVRGGGARSDLAAFDSEPVARAIALMPMPVFTGIGHEIDRAVADEVAHSCFKTPTACAQALVEQVCTFLDRMTALSNDVVTSAQRRLTADRRMVVDAGHRVSRTARSRCSLASADIARGLQRVRRGAPAALVRERGLLERRRGRAEEIAGRGVRGAEARLRSDEQTLATAGTRLSRDAARHVDGIEARLRALDPVRVLERGYSITRTNGRVVKRVGDLVPDARIVTELADGRATSRVETVEPAAPGTHEQQGGDV
ncbi:MAG TPA: exodeoxyribonuclease VII large subunit [Acidimicrobiia bacterium]